jgi:hypothetical protein
MEDLVLRSTLFKISSVLFLLFATSARAYTDLYLDSFTTSNWNASSGWQSCAAYSGGRPCISNGSYFSGDGIGSGDVVFAYTTNNISDTFGITSTMRSSTGSNYVAIDMMTGPRNSEQGNKTEYVGITIIKYSSVGSQIQSYSFSENITNTSMETFAYDIGSLANTYNIGIIISGRDGGYWAGNYGAVIGNNTLYITDTDPTAVQASPTPVYSSGITAAQSTKRTSKLSDTAAHGMEAHVNITGGNNTVDIDQHDASHYLELTIIGNSNTVDIDQDDPAGVGTHFGDVVIDGNSNTLDLLQTGSGNKTAFIGIDGNSNTVDVIQKDSGQHYLQLDLIGDGHNANIIQEGSGNHEATIELENGGGAWDFDLNQKGTTGKEYSLPHSMSDGSTTSGTCYVAAGCSLTVIQDD